MSAAIAGDEAEPRAWPWALVICGYFLFQALYRRLLGGGLLIDEAQMLLWSRELAWGYGPQPPLYSWLQRATFPVVPDRLLALALLKNALLAATYLAVYALFRTSRPRQVAGLAALCLFLLPQISWDSQRSMTHSVLVTALAALTTLAFWTRTLPGARGGWLLFGVLLGLGGLAKFNFLLVPASLLIAASTMPELRGRLRVSGMALALAVAAALWTGPLWWAWTHADRAFGTANRLHLAGEGEPRWRAALEGGGAFALAVISCLALGVLVFGLLCWFRGRPAAAGAGLDTLDRLLLRTVLVGLALALIGIVASGTTRVRDLWLLPLIYLAFPLAAVQVQLRLTSAGVRALRRTIAGLAALVTVALAVHIVYGDPTHPPLSRYPVGAMAADLEAAFPDADRIVAHPEWLAGNLIYWRPDLAVVSAVDPGPPPDDAETAVLVWWDRRPAGPEPVIDQLAALWHQPVAIGPARPLTEPFPLHPRVSFRVDAARLAVRSPVSP